MIPNKDIFVLLTFSLRIPIHGVYCEVAKTSNISEVGSIKEGQCIGDDMFKWAKVVDVTEFDEIRIIEIDNEQILYKSQDAENPCFLSRSEFDTLFPRRFEMYFPNHK